MKVLLIIAALVGLTVADVPTAFNYHQRIGISEAARIKKAEENLNFDGSRIIGGSHSALGQYPHLGGLLVALTEGRTSVCGSSVLSNTRLVTAAHCWWDGETQALYITVVLGSTTLFTGGSRLTTYDVQMHERWNPSNANNDIAILTVSWITYNNNVAPVALPTAYQSQTFAGWWVYAAGYGRTSDAEGISTSQVQSHVQLQVITNAVCQGTFGEYVVDSTICTSGNGGVGICGGDSGGPITVTSAGETILVGIASFFSDRGCELGLPSASARVTSFVSWIEDRL